MPQFKEYVDWWTGGDWLLCHSRSWRPRPKTKWRMASTAWWAWRSHPTSPPSVMLPTSMAPTRWPSTSKQVSSCLYFVLFFFSHVRVEHLDITLADVMPSRYIASPIHNDGITYNAMWFLLILSDDTITFTLIQIWLDPITTHCPTTDWLQSNVIGFQ